MTFIFVFESMLLSCLKQRLSKLICALVFDFQLKALLYSRCLSDKDLPSFDMMANDVNVIKNFLEFTEVKK